MGSIFLENFHITMQKLRNRGVLAHDERGNHAIYNWYRDRANLSSSRVLSIILAIIGGSHFLQFALGRSFVFWWGNVEHGIAGIVFAFIIGLEIYFSTQGLLLTALASAMFAAILRRRIRPQLFHKDGCNGFAPLGNLIFLLWALAILCAGAMYVVLRIGYLGIEKMYFVWVLAFLTTITIPIIAILPSFAYVRALYRTRQIKIRQLQRMFDFLWTRIEQHGKYNDRRNSRMPRPHR